jgi:2-keto-4-pentenoate hydratase/2-oxohepta-3-ene-1,7-dioic acid hydratase in catechol pathway
MKLLRFKINNKEKTGILKGNEITGINSSMIEAMNTPETDQLETIGRSKLEDVEVLPPVSPSKVVCVGLNYSDHAKELDMKLPTEPTLFIKPSTAVIGHETNVIYPADSTQVDYEGELGIVISKEAHHVKKDDATDFIGGYTILNDVTARDKQRKDIQWTRAKSFDTFAPIGPCIETELDPTNQNISLKLNGEMRQNSNTKQMIFNAYELVEFISNVMTLKPGDVIATGTPPGVGTMQVGDVVEVSIEGIGVLRNTVKAQK